MLDRPAQLVVVTPARRVSLSQACALCGAPAGRACRPATAGTPPLMHRGRAELVQLALLDRDGRPS